ncbi:MAG: alanine racemase [Betaproteobacteria bacterium]|nr:alanine racemase [Betaproteobacteria bacterium]
MSRPIQAHIDLHALRHNFMVARKHAGDAQVWAVIKANAYGHGLLRVAQALAPSADGFALVELEGAIALREAGLEHPLLLLEGFYTADELPLFSQYRLTPVLHSQYQVQALVEADLTTPMQVYLKLNTGMNRLGFDGGELRAALEKLQTAPQVSALSLMTHFADADCGEDGRGIGGQLKVLEDMRGQLDYPLSLANSAALLRYPEGLGDWVRAGIMLYGSSPFPELASADVLGLRPVMTLKSELIAVRELNTGDRIGYGGVFKAPTPMRVGIVACGYADGYPRHAPTGTPILVEGWCTRTLGRVSMDKICVDLTEIPNARVGSPVILWGDGLSADLVAAFAGTVSYELFCALAARVPVNVI